MKKVIIRNHSKKILADLITPVSMYLKLRDAFPNALLLESSDYHGNEDSYSYICLNPLATFTAHGDTITETFPDGDTSTTTITGRFTVPDRLKAFTSAFHLEDQSMLSMTNGLYGYCAYDAVKHFENIKLRAEIKPAHSVPEVRYSVYQYVIAFHPFSNELLLLENYTMEEGEGFERIESLLSNRSLALFDFHLLGGESSNLTDVEYMHMVTKGKEHCYRGDVFQIVLSRQFSQQFVGDEFNVYRALRSVNPSPYLFYFDYGDYRIFGSSPEAQIKIIGNKAVINPIAGTFKRTGNDAEDKLAAAELVKDPKENAEHVMLVDLARNDLSRNSNQVKVETYRDVQYYSHVIHLVSTVTGELKPGTNKFQIIADTFPAGTLSGAPKYKAMELIDTYENQNRSFYGGGIGYIGFDGDVNHAIMIRSFLSKNNTLYYQAGAGIVSESKEESELKEVNNKLMALKKAIELAQTL